MIGVSKVFFNKESNASSFVGVVGVVSVSARCSIFANYGVSIDVKVVLWRESGFLNTSYVDVKIFHTFCEFFLFVSDSINVDLEDVKRVVLSFDIVLDVSQVVLTSVVCCLVSISVVVSDGLVGSGGRSGCAFNAYPVSVGCYSPDVFVCKLAALLMPPHLASVALSAEEFSAVAYTFIACTAGVRRSWVCFNISASGQIFMAIVGLIDLVRMVVLIVLVGLVDLIGFIEKIGLIDLR